MTDYGNPIPTSGGNRERESRVATDAPSRIIEGVSLRDYDMFELVVGVPPKSLDEVNKFKKAQAQAPKSK